MSKTLKDIVKEHVADPAVAGLALETVHRPLGGSSAAVSPPTYSRPEEDRSKAPYHAVSDGAFIPARDESGWYSAIRRNADGSPVLGPRVVLDSVGAQSGASETCLWHSQDRLGISLPALIVGGDSAPEDGAGLDAQVAAALGVEVSTWEAAHRHNDAWVKFAETMDGTPVWQDESSGSVKELITTTSARTGEQLYRYFPNAAVYGFWLSSGSAARHKMPRAYSSEIVGYGARAVKTGATKLDPVGGASEKSNVGFRNNELTTGPKGKKPSAAGFGQVPRTVYVTQYACELILQQASISLSVLRSIGFADPAVKQSALTTLTLLALTGHALAGEDGFLRTGCALVPVEQRFGWVSRGSATPEALEIESTDAVIEALRESVEETAGLGLALAEPIRLRYSAAERQLITERVEIERAKAFDGGE
ncbi:type I-G CRISPR-associated protein Cas7 [Brevibacterium salitolerans]|uniref:Type I-U CRISPR-associated protein Cas7 n=1 Tax=Brevibacterium salitolerans TaxID=1403566 RepID=A0ABP5I5V9_9MICO